MVGVKKFIVDKSNISEVGQKLLEEYHNISIFSAGTEEHEKAGLSAGKVLIRAWNKRKEVME